MCATRCFRVAGRVACLLVFTLAAALSHASGGRDFAGIYEITNVNDLGPTVRLTLSVRLFNYSGAKVAGASLTLQDSVLPGQAYGSFPALSFGDHESVRRSADLTIPRVEYERWRRGGSPNLVVEFHDAQGNLVRRRAEVILGRLGREK